MVAKGTGKVGLAAAGGSGDEHVFTTADPGEVGQQGELLFRQVVRWTWINVVGG